MSQLVELFLFYMHSSFTYGQYLSASPPNTKASVLFSLQLMSPTDLLIGRLPCHTIAEEMESLVNAYDEMSAA